MAEENQVPRRLRRFYRQGNSEGAAQEERDVFSKPLPLQASQQSQAEGKKKFEAAPEGEQEEQAETIYREQESEEKEIDWDKKRKEELEKMKGQLTTQKVKEFREKHNRLPQGSEEEEIARSVFGQLQKEEEKMKKEERQKRIEGKNQKEEKGAEKVAGFRGRKGKEIPQAGIAARAEENEVEIKGSEMIDLLKEGPQKKSGKKAQAEEPEEGELGELEDVGEEGEEEEDESETSNAKSCPNCRKETEETVFCPECGAEFCNNCSAPKQMAGKLKYKCPKCGYEFSKSG